MIPLSLRVRNFMSYGESVPPLDFGQFHLACLCGDNGHGKSALLDAMTWALWGRSRAKSEDDLIQIGKLEAEVELEFALGSERYCVLRKRALRASGKRRVATPTLELQIHDGDRYRPLTGESVTQTQAALNSVLRMDYETFINSAFILQGRADEFTLKTPADRKKVLADLLGLERYDELEARAREESRRCAGDRATTLAQIEEIDRELARQPEYEAQLTEAEARLARAEAERRAAEAELARWRHEEHSARARQNELERAREAQTLARRERETLALRLEGEQREVARLAALVTRGPELRQAVARLAELREREASLGRAAAGLLTLTDERAELERKIAAARERVVAELARANHEAARLQSLAAQAGGLEKQFQAAQAELAALEQGEAEREAGRRAVQTAELESRSLQEANARLRDEMDELKKRLDMLGQAGATCPLCQGKLTAEGRAALEGQLEAEGKQHADEYRRNTARVKELQAQQAAASAALQELERRLAGRGRAEAKVTTLKRSLDEAWEAAGAMIALTERVSELDAQLRDGRFMPGESRRLAELTERIASLGYDQAEHERVRASLRELTGAEAELAEVAAAEAARPAAEERAGGTAALLASREQALAQIAAQLEELEAEAARLAEIEAEVQRASAACDAAVQESQAARELRGVARQRIDHCRYLAGERAERAGAAARAGEEKTIYDELALAFGKKGIQAMIIEGAIPEIEQEANELLARLTDGQLSLTFETQREARFADNLIETLDIKISDAYGTRGYEMYSGGEAFRVNFAIRIALSKLLARRAGTQLQLLVIDEGFGTQDAIGRERLVEALAAITGEFEKILVVTHIQELKDAFPYRIDVVKGPEGSQIVGAAPLDG
ncbi:MAG TPA: SMC family ATPase [Chloroflexota bacterium]|nr:SMC family ATPase [Chloroflexota bacterium]